MADKCAHCGKQGAAGVVLKRCSVCKQDSYCGANCQRAGWKQHKKTCQATPPLKELCEILNAAIMRDDWPGVLKWEGRMELMMASVPSDPFHDHILRGFANAHKMIRYETGTKDHALDVIRIQERRVEILGRMQRFRDQGEAMNEIADHLRVVGKRTEAIACFHKLRDLGAAHGFFSVETNACVGLGLLAMEDGRNEAGLELLRNAVAAGLLNENDENSDALGPMAELINALFLTNGIDEVEPLVLRFREGAKEKSRQAGRVRYAELLSLKHLAKLHKVPCILIPCGEFLHNALPFHSTKANTAFLTGSTPRIEPVHLPMVNRVTTHTILEACALSRHAGGLARPRGRCAVCSTFCKRARSRQRPKPKTLNLSPYM